MMSSLVRRAALAAMICCVSISGCKCGSKVQSDGCSSDQECIDQNGGLDRWFCDTTKAPPACALHPKQCDTSADCCPAQVCNAQGHYCFDKYSPCTVDGSCPAQGQVCKTIGVFPSGNGCTFEKCSAGNACGAGTSCFNGYCVGEPPCNGGCGGGKVCVTATNLCSPAPKDATCSQTCASGKILVLKDPNNIFDICRPDTESCECDSLPPIQTRDVSRYSSMTSFQQNLYVSAYDGEHGDLVVHTFDKSDLSKPTKSDWVDGVPASGHIGGDTSGPRGGITDPGPNVGQYTSIVASATGDLYVSYYDVDNGDLKFVARYGGSAAAWGTPVTVDGSTAVNGAPSNGDVGMYSSIALDKNGIPAIAYFRKGDYDAGSHTETGRNTALLYAVAKKTQPLTKDDWTVFEVEAALRPNPPCNNACSATQLCVVDANATDGERCATKSTATCLHTDGTAPGCTGNNACVLDTDQNQTPVCRATRAADVLAELPKGTGLMPSLGFIDDHPVIAYYENGVKDANGKPINAVKAIMGAGGGQTPQFGAAVELDGHDPDPASPAPPTRQRDTGRWPALAIGPQGATNGRIAIAFSDRTAQQLLIYTSDGLTSHAAHVAAGASGLIHVVDDGKAPNPNSKWHPQGFPGVQTAVAFTASGKIALAYQEGMAVDLQFATYDPAQNKTTGISSIRTDGSAGFWPRLAIVSGTAYMSSASIKAATATIPFNQLFVDQKPAP